MKPSVLSLLCLLLLTSCQKDLDDEADCLQTGLLILPSFLETEYGCSDTRHLEVNLSEDYALVRSQQEFETLVTGESCRPEIDFERFDLVIGKKGLSSGNSSIGYDFGSTCTRGELLLKVTFYQNLATVAPNITYHALIPKLQEGQRVKVEFEIRPAGPQPF